MLRRLVVRVVRLLLRATPSTDHWERFDLTVEHRRFGTGSIASFKWYFQGPSRVDVGTIEEVGEWLARCRYESDRELFATDDHWQHPADFERLQRGDCEDHALWAWRKLVELGLDAEFVVGRYAQSNAPDRGHAWVVFRDSAGETHLLEAVSKDLATIVRPLASVRHLYVPHFAVNRNHRTCAFGGYLEDQKRREQSAARSKRRIEGAA